MESTEVENTDGDDREHDGDDYVGEWKKKFDIIHSTLLHSFYYTLLYFIILTVFISFFPDEPDVQNINSELKKMFRL